MESDTIYIGRSNPSKWRLEADGDPIDLGAIQRFVIALDDGEAVTRFDSQSRPDLFSAGAGGVLSLHLGGAQLAPGRYRMTITTYDPDHPAGLDWEPVALYVEQPAA